MIVCPEAAGEGAVHVQKRLRLRLRGKQTFHADPLKIYETDHSTKRFVSIGAVENLHGVQNRDAFTEDHVRKMSFNLRHAADVARGDDVGLGRDDRSRLLIAEFCGCFWLLDVVGSRRAATHVSVGSFNKFEVSDRSQQLPWLRFHLLRVSQVTGIAISQPGFRWQLRRSSDSQLRQKNADLVDRSLSILRCTALSNLNTHAK